MTDRVLVTGASGFIGHHLTQALLESGFQVSCLVRRTSDVSHLPTGDIALVYGDLSDPETLLQPTANADIVFHLAGLTTASRPDELFATNQRGTRSLAQACRTGPSAPVFVMLSSLAAAGPSSPENPLVEGEPTRPVSAYGRSKLAGEMAVREFADDLPVTIVRASAVFGEWDRDVLQIFQFITRGFHLVPFPRQARYSAIHAADLSRLMICAAQKGERCSGQDPDPGRGLYYAAYDVDITYTELGDLIAASLERARVHTLLVPRMLTLLIAGSSELVARVRGQPPGIVNLDKTREFFAGSWSCSPYKALEAFELEFPISFEDRLRQTARWYQDQGWL